MADNFKEMVSGQSMAVAHVTSVTGQYAQDWHKLMLSKIPAWSGEVAMKSHHGLRSY